MLFYLTLIFSCQLAGELITSLTGIPVPGPVLGMALLFIGLLIKGRLPDTLGQVADTLAVNLSLLFVPAGVGVMLHARLIARELVPITVALVASTLIAIAVTALMMRRLGRPSAAGEK